MIFQHQRGGVAAHPETFLSLPAARFAFGFRITSQPPATRQPRRRDSVRSPRHFAVVPELDDPSCLIVIGAGVLFGMDFAGAEG
jgi:hypothetical protein